MEDSHCIAHGEIQGLQQRKNEQAARKNRSSPPRTILPSTFRNPCCLLRRIVGSGSLFPESHISARCTLDPRGMSTNRPFPYVAYWSPSIKERIGELSSQRLEDLPRPSRTPKIGLRGRVTITIVGFAIFWGSGLVEGNIYARGQTMVVCMDNTCAALVVIAAVGFWIAIIGGISVVVWILRRFL